MKGEKKTIVEMNIEISDRTRMRPQLIVKTLDGTEYVTAGNFNAVEPEPFWVEIK